MLDFLLDSPFLFVIIIMALSSLFGSGKKKKPEQRPQGGHPAQTTQRQPQSQVGRSQSESLPTESMFDKLRRELEKQLAPPETEPVQTVVQKEVKSRESIEERKIERKTHLEKEYKALEQALAKNQNTVSALKTTKITKSKVVEGIIWSEILGAPRSRKPFKPNGYRN